MNSATNPAPNVQQDDYTWAERRAQKQAAAQSGSHDLIFIGDSITHRFERDDVGGPVWQKFFGRLRVLNLGYGWDTTQNVLWRLTEGGEFAGQRPRLVVLNIGTNNLTGNSACPANTTAEIVEGIAAICDLVQHASPETKILVMSIFPRGRRVEMINARVHDLNQEIRLWLTTRPELLHLDIGEGLLKPGGEIDPVLVPDLCHPVEPGYVVWGEALQPLVKQYVG